MRASALGVYLAISLSALGSFATEPTATEPTATEPTATEPAATEPAATEPAATEPAATDSAQATVAPDSATAEDAQADEQREALKKSLLLLPLRNTSDYEGPWDIHTQLPRGLADSLSRSRFLRVISVDSGLVRLDQEDLDAEKGDSDPVGQGRSWLSRLLYGMRHPFGQRQTANGTERIGEISRSRAVELGRELEADVVVLGEVQVLSMKRFRAVVPLGGYRSYEGSIEVQLHFYNVIDGTPMGEFLGTGLLDTKRTGVTNPVAYLPMEKEYYLLGNSPAAWGSQAFVESLVGQAVALCLHDLAAGVAEVVLPPPELIAKEPKIIDITGAQAYINVGLANGVRNGDKYGVWDRGRQLSDPDTGIVLGFALPARVGVVQVERILTERLSQVRVLEGQQDIEVGYSIRAE